MSFIDATTPDVSTRIIYFLGRNRTTSSIVLAKDVAARRRGLTVLPEAMQTALESGQNVLREEIKTV